MWRERWWSVKEKDGAVVSCVEADFCCESEDLGKKRSGWREEGMESKRSSGGGEVEFKGRKRREAE